jgi:NADPH-dependent 7-cyano-7-deazaguanine reductase QueF
VTFPGAPDQPDFGTLYVMFFPGEKVIELKVTQGIPVLVA